MDFFERAKLVGHDVARLRRGERIESQYVVSSIEEFKRLFASDLTPDQRAAFASYIANLQQGLRVASIPDATLSRLANYVSGTGTLQAGDEAYCRTLFPITISAVSEPEYILDTDVDIGPAAPPYFMNVARFTIKGGSLTIRNTVATILADSLIVKSGGTKPYHIGILGAKGRTGDRGTAATPVSPPRAAKGTTNDAGGDAVNGGPGGHGWPGGPGLSSLNATITVQAVDPASAPLVVFTQSGEGGTGGAGADGAKGQNGADGADGEDDGCGGTDGKAGKMGGTGGAGGRGGEGGSGTSGMPIAIAFPSSAKSKLTLNSQSADPGRGGTGGKGGAGGDRGNGGAPGKGAHRGADGTDGKIGADALDGERGAASGAPGSFDVDYF